MKKILSIITFLILSISVLAVSTMAKVKSCDDSDDTNPDSESSIVSTLFIGGYTIDEDNDKNFDNCFGHEENTPNHEKIRERFCDGDKSDKVDRDCQDYGAVCVEDAVNGDHCRCPEGTHFDDNECVPNSQEPRCGDGNVDVGLGEECDDGNTADGDGCSANCTIEENNHEIPEFTTIGAGLVLAGAGAYMYRKRSKK